MSPLARPPADPAGLACFPTYALGTDRVLFRTHTRHRGPWRFSHVDPVRPRRFDLPAPAGTCYLGEEDLGAFLEALQDEGTAIPRAIPWAEVAIRRTSRLSVPKPMTLADCTQPAAAAYGITGEIHSSSDRNQTQEWARAFAGAGFEGVRYLARSDPAQRQVSIALFGSAGEAAWAALSTDVIDPDLIERVKRIFGIRFIP